jgi:hypothetical protein
MANRSSYPCKKTTGRSCNVVSPKLVWLSQNRALFLKFLADITGAEGEILKPTLDTS